MYQRVDLSLSKSQFDKLSRGHPIQLSQAQLQSGNHWLALHPETAKKVMKAKRSGKGARIHMSPAEMEASGEGIKEFLRKAKKAARWLKSNVIDSKLYQESVRPLARQVVDRGVSLASAYLGPQAAPLLQKGVEALSKETGAFGLKKGRKSSPKHRVAKSSEQIILCPSCGDQSRLISMAHPAQYPVRLPPIGGSFRAI